MPNIFDSIPTDNGKNVFDSIPDDKGGNVFDSIPSDVPTPNKQYTSSTESFGDKAKGVMEGIAHAGKTTMDFFPQLLSSGFNAVVSPGDTEKNFNENMRSYGARSPEMNEGEPTTLTGQKLSNAFDEAVTQTMPVMGLAHVVPAPFRGKRPGPVGKDIPPPKASVAPEPPPPPPGPGMPDVMQVTPEGQAMRPEDAFWRDRAQQMQSHEQDAMDRSTSGISYENVPPDGVIPRSRPNGSLEVPKRGDWVPDENNIPVRQGLPEATPDLSPEARAEGMSMQDEAARNDLGNAIQEANGPKLGPDEPFGSEPLSGPMGAPEMPRSPGGRQRGAVNMDVFTPGFEKARMINDGIKLVLKGGFAPIITAFDRFGKVVGNLKLMTDTMEPRPDSNLQAAYVHVADHMRGKGIAEKMYRFAAENGNDIDPSGTQTSAGERMWGKFVERGFAVPDGRLPLKNPNKPIRIPASQRGAVDMEAVSKGLADLLGRRVKTAEGVGKVVDHKVVLIKNQDAISNHLDRVHGEAWNQHENMMDASNAARDAQNKWMEEEYPKLPYDTPTGRYDIEYPDGTRKFSYGDDIEHVFEKGGLKAVPSSQRGAVDIKALTDGLRALKTSMRGDTRWLKDDKGDPAIVFRGNNMPDSGPNHREGYATFVTDNPHLANTFVRTSFHGDPMDGTVHPFVIKSGVKVIEFPAGKTYGGFNKFAFDQRARSLGPNEVLVVRNSTDHGPGEVNDPFKRAGLRADQYAFTDPNVVVPLMEAAKDAQPEPPKPSSFNLKQIQYLKQDIKELESKPLTPTTGENANDPSRYGDFTLTKGFSGEKYVQKFNEYARQDALEKAKQQLAQMQADLKVPKNQRGAIDFKGIGEAFSRGVEKLHDGFDKINPLTPKEQVLANAVGKPYIPKPDPVEQSIAKARTEQDGPALFKNLQSGPSLAAEKTGSTLVRETARWNNWGDKVADYWKNNVVTPIQKSLTGLHGGHASDLWKVMQNEMRTRTRYSPEELAQHLSPKAQAAYRQLRAAQADVLQKTNEQLAAKGQPPISEHEAYAASVWDGQWHLPVDDKTGKKLVWYVKAKTEAEALRAQKWIADNTGLTTDNKPKYYNENLGRKVPRDVLGTYHDMARFFSDQPRILENISDAAEHYTEAQGYKFMGHYVHFHNKAGAEGVRGYLGDRPWLSERENAKQGLEAQTKYLRSAYDWIGKQEALANTAKLLADPELAKQTNNMAMARAYTAQSMGVTQNLIKSFENGVQQMLTTSVKGHSLAVDISKVVHSVKELTYLTQLGFSPAYMVATPLQALILGPSWHQKLGGEYNVASVMAKSMADMGGMFPGGKAFTSLGEKAFKFMNDNGVISQNVFHENVGNGSVAPVAALRKVGGWTISAPERVARASTFLSFVHHMDETGMFKQWNADGTTYVDHDAMFQRAEELTNHVLTDFRRSNRPLLIDKLGQGGEVMYTYKAPIFNFYNNMSVFARDALKGKPMPFLTAVGMTTLLAGYVGIPLLRELDDGLQAFKTAVSHLWPEHYPKIRDWGIIRPVVANIRQAANNKAFQDAVGGPGVAEMLSNTMTHGAPSALSKVQMSTRFSANVGDIRNPFDGIAPVVQEGREAISGGKALLNQTSTNALEAVWQQMPPLGKGNMEEMFDRFKGPTNPKTGEHGVINPNHLTEDQNVYTRSPEEQTMRRMGVTSLKEATTKNDWYENRQEAERWKTAQESSIDKLWNAIREHQPVEKLRPYAKAFYENYGNDDGLDQGINQKIENMALDPRQRAIMKAETLSKIMEIKRYLETRGELHHAN